MGDKKSATQGQAAQSATTLRRILTEKTLIADVVDYAIELHARERAEIIARHPNTPGAPKWLVGLLVVVFVAVVGSFLVLLSGGSQAVFTDSPHRTATLIGAGVLVVLALATIMVHAAKVGQLPPSRIEELVELDKKIKGKFDELGLKCYGCGAAYVQTFEQGAKIHGFDVDAVLRGLRELDLDLELTNPDRPLPTPDESPTVEATPNATRATK